MADDDTASGIPVLSAFDKLKLSGSNNYILNRNNTCTTNNPSNRSQIDKNSNSVVKVTTASASSAASETSAIATESSKCEKSISLPLAQFECNNKTIMMFSGSEVNATTFASSSTSACGMNRASCFTSFPPPSPTTLTPIISTKSEKTMQNPCGATDNNGAIAPPLTSSLSSYSQSVTASISSPSLASIAMVLPNSVNATNFDMFPSPSLSSSISSPNLSVQNKVKKFDTNEVTIKLLKSGKCKTPLSVASNASMMQLKPTSAPPIVCAPPPTVLPNQINKFENNSGGNKKSSPKAKNQSFGFPMLPGRLTTAAAVTKQNLLNMDNKKRQTTGNDQDTTTEDRNKKKRCSDRYDSSESSDSGVATSLSCTDSSTASSDVSDPGSPYSPVLIGDDLHQKTIMPPQTILATTNGNAAKSPTTGAATPVQSIKGGKHQQKHQNQVQNKGVTPQQQQKQGKSQIASPLQKVSQHLWPWTSLGGGVGGGGNFSELASSPKTTITALNNKNNNKRHSQVSSTPTDGGAKKTRTTNVNTVDAINVNGVALLPPQIASNNKRLKVAAMEESQTKITGYFKSQMKAQIHQSGLKKETMAHILPSSSMSTSSPSVTVTAIGSSSSMSSTHIVPTTTTASTSLNKYFNLLSSQLRDDQERISNPTTSLISLPPALKKIERSKPTKIAQVAPNLRKTTAAPPLCAQVIEKSPKKHVAIAPRTADTRQRHEPSPMKPPAPPPQQQQPAVLLTTIRIPQPNQPPQLVPASPQHTQVTVGSVSKTQQNGASAAASKLPTGPSLYQIPMMPNLVQFPNLIAANVSQLTAARGNHHHPTTTAQYFLNGTVFKLQQFTAPSAGANPPTFSIENGNQSINTATVTTTATSIEQHTSNTKNTSSITATTFQDMLSNQFHTQQQSVAAHNHRLHHSQPVFMATTAGLLLNAASLPAMLNSNKQTMTIQSQQIPALQPIQGANAMMPGLSSIFSSHQDVATQQLQHYKSDPVGLDTHNPLQQTNLPPLSVSSSAFNKLGIVKAGAAFNPAVHQVSATQPPPLVTISSGSQNVIVSSKASGNKTSVSAKPYQKKNGQQGNVAKSKKIATESVKKPLLEPISPVLLPHPTLPPPPSKSPPALAYPSLFAHKEEQKLTEDDLFDLLKNSKNETTLTPPSTVEEENGKEEILIKTYTPLLSPETTSSSTVSDESIKLEESAHPLESSLTSTPLISSESSTLIIDFKREETETTVNVSETSSADSTAETLSPTVDTTLADSDTLPKSAISPILSQPKTIRFPAKHESGYRFGPKGMRRHDGVCYWDKCNKKHESSSKLLDHMQTHHVNTQTGPFACLWLGCKVYGRESCSRRWLERHVLSHGGTKPFKCIVDGCGLRFGSQLALQKHVNGHFTATESKDSTSKRTSDPPVPKLLRKNGKKLRYRRQPFSARMFDFFDAGIMEGLQHRLRQISTLTNGDNAITFRGQITMRRKTLKGVAECLVQWTPPDIISDEWLPETSEYVKTIPISRMQPNEKTNVELLLKSAYRLPHSPNLFQSFDSLSRQNSQDSTTTYQDHSQSIANAGETTDETSRSSLNCLSSISDLPIKLPQIELRQKQSRKPPKRIQPS